MPSSQIQPAFGGTAVVCCVHNREKRQVQQLAFDPRITSIHLCACCENVFLEPSDTPMFCPECRRPPAYALAAPLPAPKGRV